MRSNKKTAVGDLEAALTPSHIADLRAGEVNEFALGVFVYMARHLRNGDPVPEPAATFLADALEKISKGADPARALALKRKRGRKEKFDRYELAQAAFDLIENGTAPTRAFDTVAQRYEELHPTKGLSKDAVEDAYSMCAEAIRVKRGVDFE